MIGLETILLEIKSILLLWTSLSFKFQQEILLLFYTHYHWINKISQAEFFQRQVTQLSVHISGMRHCNYYSLHIVDWYTYNVLATVLFGFLTTQGMDGGMKTVYSMIQIKGQVPDSWKVTIKKSSEEGQKILLLKHWEYSNQHEYSRISYTIFLNLCIFTYVLFIFLGNSCISITQTLIFLKIFLEFNKLKKIYF